MVLRSKITAALALGFAVACAGAPANPAVCPPAASAAPAPVLSPPVKTAEAPQPAAADPLPSWNEGASKQAIVAFVARTTTPSASTFVPVEQRVAVFDNDGTLWSEQPIYVQLAFALDRVRELAPTHPEWKTREPFKSVLAGDLKAALASGEKGMVELLTATHTGMTTDEFERTVQRWFSTARHPKYGRLYTDCVYQPMVELLAYLRANGFKTFIVSGGGIDFMRPVTQKLYGIPPEQVVGSTGKLRFELRDGKPIIMRDAGVSFIDDHEGKPVGIQQHIGRRPIAAFGNSDGDQQMLEWTASGDGPRLALLVHHTDAEREVAYDRASAIGKLDHALDEATSKGWIVVNMKDDWKTIFPQRVEAVQASDASLQSTSLTPKP